jgi:NAD(P)-dependent dehydrogenase (short-subunit alcohol dehydrogenase family)
MAQRKTTSLGHMFNLNSMNIRILRQSTAKRILHRRLGKSEEIAAAVHYLVINEAAFITDTVLIIDGAWSAR